MEYKTIRQYQSMGEMLSACTVYGFRGGVEHMLEKDKGLNGSNGHGWLTEDPLKE